MTASQLVEAILVAASGPGSRHPLGSRRPRRRRPRRRLGDCPAYRRPSLRPQLQRRHERALPAAEATIRHGKARSSRVLRSQPCRCITLPWFPPAPAPGPASLLELPPDDWALEPEDRRHSRYLAGGRPFTRQGSLLSASKGADRLCQHLSAVEHTLDGEWVPAARRVLRFRLPNCPLTYDERRSALAKILGLVAGTEFDPPLSCTVPALALIASIPHICLIASYTGGRFPQVYSGLKGMAPRVSSSRRADHFTPSTSDLVSKAGLAQTAVCVGLA